MPKLDSEEEFSYLTLRFEPEEIPVDPGGEPNEYLYERAGEILSVGDDDQRTLVGRFRVFYVDANSATNDGVNVFDVLDTHSETEPYYEYLYGNNGWPSPKLEKLFGETPLNGNALILARLEILPQFRNQGFGLLVLRRLIQRFSAGVGIVAMKPYPLQFEAHNDAPDGWRDQLQLTSFPEAKKVAFAKLRDYYGELGFEHLPGTEYMFLAAEAKLITVEEIRDEGRKRSSRTKI